MKIPDEYENLEEAYQIIAANNPAKNTEDVRPNISVARINGTGANTENGPPRQRTIVKICKKIKSPKELSVFILSLKLEIAIIVYNT